MEERRHSIWTTPWKGLAGFMVSIVVVALATLAVIVSISLVTGLSWKPLQIAVFTIIGPVILLAVLFGQWLYCWRNLRRFLFVAVCLFTALVLIVTEENWRGRHEWETYKREQEAKGEKFSLTALSPPPVPDNQNFALTPLLKPVLDFRETPQGVRWNDTNGYERLIRLTPLRSPPGFKGNNPTLGSTETGLYADLDEWQRFYRGNTNYSQAEIPGTAAADILAGLSEFNPEIEELRNAAQTRPYSRFPIQYDYEPAAQILLPHLAPVKMLAEMVNLRAVCELEQHRPAAAFADLNLGFRLSDSISNEPIFIDHLVRLATLNMGLQTVREGIERHSWSDDQLSRLEDYLASLNLLGEFGQSMRGERALGVDDSDYIRRGGTLGSFNSGKAVRPFAKIIGRIAGAFFFQNMLTLCQWHGQFTLASVDDHAHRVFPQIGAMLDKKMAGIFVAENHIHPLDHPYEILAAMRLQPFSKAALRSARIQTSVDQATVACALERYYLANKSYPASLGPLSPQYIKTIPTDVIDGQPLRYHAAAGGGYIIYSIGWNEKDDDGAVVFKPHDSGVDATQGDWVWSSSTL